MLALWAASAAFVSCLCNLAPCFRFLLLHFYLIRLQVLLVMLEVLFLLLELVLGSSRDVRLRLVGNPALHCGARALD